MVRSTEHCFSVLCGPGKCYSLVKLKSLVSFLINVPSSSYPYDDHLQSFDEISVCSRTVNDFLRKYYFVTTRLILTDRIRNVYQLILSSIIIVMTFITDLTHASTPLLPHSHQHPESVRTKVAKSEDYNQKATLMHDITELKCAHVYGGVPMYRWADPCICKFVTADTASITEGQQVIT